MNIHKFECANNHTFFLPLNLPADLNKFRELIGKIVCPVCHCSKELIKMNAREMLVIEVPE